MSAGRSGGTGGGNDNLRNQWKTPICSEWRLLPIALVAPAWTGHNHRPTHLPALASFMSTQLYRSPYGAILAPMTSPAAMPHAVAVAAGGWRRVYGEPADDLSGVVPSAVLEAGVFCRWRLCMSWMRLPRASLRGVGVARRGDRRTVVTC